MLANVAALLTPLVLSTSLGVASPSLHHDVHAFVTGYNTIPGQTDSTPCIAASGADICGRRDAVACPRRISLGTVVEIRGTTYVCEDRLAKKYDTRFDISCDKDTTCPPGVTGWTTIKVYGEERAAPPVVAAARSPHLAHNRVPARVRPVGHAAIKVATNAGHAVSVLRGRG